MPATQPGYTQKPYLPPAPILRPKRLSVECRGEKASTTNSGPGLGLKAVWTAAEKFGDHVGRRKGLQQPKHVERERPAEPRKMSKSDVIASLKADYDNSYFVSGTGAMEAYEPDCEFADPFASFRGTGRFKKNVGNLGGLAQEVRCDILDWREEEDLIATKWRFRAVLDLPWRPLLAAKGGTTHFLNKDTGKVEKHLEMWDTEPQRVLLTLLKPTAKVPSNQWEKFFLAVSQGDLFGAWAAISYPTLKVDAVLFTSFLVYGLLSGQGLQASLQGTAEQWCYALAAACLITELIKFAQIGTQKDQNYKAKE